MESKVPNGFVNLYTSTQEQNKSVNVIGIVTDVMTPKPTKGTDWMLTFSLDDASGVIGSYDKGQKVRVFGKERSLPSLNGPGDVVLLRNIKCTASYGQTILASHYEHTTWTVFYAPIPKDLGPFRQTLKHSRSNKAPMPTVPEMEYVISLAHGQDPSKFSAPLSQKDKQRLSQGDKFSLVRDIQVQNYYDLVGEVIKIFPVFERTQLYITDYTENSFLHAYGRGDDLAGLDFEEGKKWRGPPGRYSLLIECFPPHALYIRENIKVGDLVLIRNVHAKQNRKSPEFKIEGVLHTEPRGNEDRVNVKVLKDKKDERLLSLLERKEALGFVLSEDSHDSDSATNSKKRKADDEPKNSDLSKNQRRKQKQKRQKKEAQILKEQANQKNAEFENNASEASKAERSKSAAVPLTSQQTTMRNALTALNVNIRCQGTDQPEHSVAQIIDNNRDQRTAEDGMLPVLDHSSLTSVTTVRVVDFKPARLEDFALQRVRRDSDASSSSSDNESAPPSSPGSADSDADSEHSAASLQRKSTQYKRSKWDWRFALLLEDARSDAPRHANGESDRMIAFVEGPDAEFLLRMRAKDLRHNPRSLAQLREKMFILWGDLEERKTREEKEKEANGGGKAKKGAGGKDETLVLRTLPFKCCVREYGVKVAEATYQRRFALCETTIMLGDAPGPKVQVKNGATSEAGAKEPKAVKHGVEKQTYRAPRAG